MNEVDINEINRDVIAQFRANGGRVDTGRFGGAELLLLTIKGRKTGRARVNPLMYLRDGGRYIVFASKAGSRSHPDWYRNLTANPDVTVEVGAERFEARAIVTSGEERQRIWEASVREKPFLADHQARAAPREIPVIALERKG